MERSPKSTHLGEELSTDLAAPESDTRELETHVPVGTVEEKTICILFKVLAAWRSDVYLSQIHVSYQPVTLHGA